MGVGASTCAFLTGRKVLFERKGSSRSLGRPRIQHLGFRYEKSGGSGCGLFSYLCARISMDACLCDCLNEFLEWLQVSHANFFKCKLCYLNPLFYFDHYIKEWKYLTLVLITCSVLKVCYIDRTFFISLI